MQCVKNNQISDPSLSYYHISIVSIVISSSTKSHLSSCIEHFGRIHYATLHYTTLLHYTSLYYTTQRYTTLHYTTLHCRTFSQVCSVQCRTVILRGPPDLLVEKSPIFTSTLVGLVLPNRSGHRTDWWFCLPFAFLGGPTPTKWVTVSVSVV